MLKAYLKYRRTRLNAHGIHSPFVFEFYNEVLKKAKQKPIREIENLRKQLKRSNKIIEVNDLGAGSRKGNNKAKQVAQIAKNAGIRAKYGQLLSRLVEFYKIDSGLEFGTSLGLGSSYLQFSNEKLNLITMEGCSNTAEIAQTNFSKLGLNHITIKTGEFSNLIADKEFEGKLFDLIYIDGNHKREPTLAYFEFALEHTHDESFIIFDDIHWSDEMEQAWRNVIEDMRINVSLDLFQLGIVCKRNGQRKQHFILKY